MTSSVYAYKKNSSGKLVKTGTKETYVYAPRTGGGYTLTTTKNGEAPAGSIPAQGSLAESKAIQQNETKKEVAKGIINDLNASAERSGANVRYEYQKTNSKKGGSGSEIIQYTYSQPTTPPTGGGARSSPPPTSIPEKTIKPATTQTQPEKNKNLPWEERTNEPAIRGARYGLTELIPEVFKPKNYQQIGGKFSPVFFYKPTSGLAKTAINVKNKPLQTADIAYGAAGAALIDTAQSFKDRPVETTAQIGTQVIVTTAVFKGLGKAFPNKVNIGELSTGTKQIKNIETGATIDTSVTTGTATTRTATYNIQARSVGETKVITQGENKPIILRDDYTKIKISSEGGSTKATGSIHAETILEKKGTATIGGGGYKGTINNKPTSGTINTITQNRKATFTDDGITIRPESRVQITQTTTKSKGKPALTTASVTTKVPITVQKIEVYAEKIDFNTRIAGNNFIINEPVSVENTLGEALTKQNAYSTITKPISIRPKTINVKPVIDLNQRIADKGGYIIDTGNDVTIGMGNTVTKIKTKPVFSSPISANTGTIEAIAKNTIQDIESTQKSVFASKIGTATGATITIKQPENKLSQASATIQTEKITPTRNSFTGTTIRTTEKIRPRQEPTPRYNIDTRSKAITTTKSRIEQRTQTDTIIMPETIQETRAVTKIKIAQTPASKQIITPPPPIKPPVIGFGKAFPHSTGKSVTGYNVFVRRKGVFNKVNAQPFTKESAINYGGSIVENSLAATFKITPVETKRAFNTGATSKSYQYRRKDGLYIQKSRFRLGTIGEKTEIKKARRIF